MEKKIKKDKKSKEEPKADTFEYSSERTKKNKDEKVIKASKSPNNVKKSETKDPEPQQEDDKKV